MNEVHNERANNFGKNIIAKLYILVSQLLSRQEM